MIFSLLFELVLVVGLSVLAHAVIAYVVAPKRAKNGILEALVSDNDFQEEIVLSLLENFFKKTKWKDNNGETVEIEPIQLVSNYILTGMKQWINGKQSEMTQELEKNATEAMQIDPTNPMMALAMQQIPKKYRPYIQLVANYLNQNR